MNPLDIFTITIWRDKKVFVVVQGTPEQNHQPSRLFNLFAVEHPAFFVPLTVHLHKGCMGRKYREGVNGAVNHYVNMLIKMAEGRKTTSTLTFEAGNEKEARRVHLDYIQSRVDRLNAKADAARGAGGDDHA